MPRVSGVSGSSTVWRIFRSPMPCTVFACVLSKPIVLRTSVTFSVFAAAVFPAFLAIRCALRCRRRSGADELALFLATHPRHQRGILQTHQPGEGRPHHVVRVGGAERL